MDIQVIGMGNTGATIANDIIKSDIDIDTLYICDIDKNRLLGEYRDLSDAKRIFERDMKIIPRDKPYNDADLHIICVGERFYLETMNELMPNNYILVRGIVKKLRGKSFIVTNPSITISRLLKFDGFDVEPTGKILDSVRLGYSGKEVRELKGHTNWGISAEILKTVKKALFHAPIEVK